MKIEDFKNYNFSILGNNTSVNGDITLSGDCIINAHINGALKNADKSKITIERSALIEGEVYCHDLEVFGHVNGSIVSTGNVIVRSCGIVSGSITSKNLSIYPGAQVNSKIHSGQL